jgi:hypothetical protein
VGPGRRRQEEAGALEAPATAIASNMRLHLVGRWAAPPPPVARGASACGLMLAVEEGGHAGLGPADRAGVARNAKKHDNFPPTCPDA